MFRGINQVNLDTKGRLNVPTRYRDRLAEVADGQIVVTIDLDSPCLLMYPLPEWEIIEKKLEVLPTFNPQARRIQRLLIGHAQEIKIDNSGRILLPTPLREFAALEDGIVLVGQGKKCEIWSEKNWEHGRQQWLEEDIYNKGELPPEVLSLSL